MSDPASRIRYARSLDPACDEDETPEQREEDSIEFDDTSAQESSIFRP